MAAFFNEGACFERVGEDLTDDVFYANIYIN